MNQLKFTNTNYPELVGHSVKVKWQTEDRVCVLFFTGFCAGVSFVCSPDNIGPVAQRKAHKAKSMLDQLIEYWHNRIAA